MEPTSRSHAISSWQLCWTTLIYMHILSLSHTSIRMYEIFFFDEYVFTLIHMHILSLTHTSIRTYEIFFFDEYVCTYVYTNSYADIFM